MERLLDLDAIEAELWSQLERAPRERGHGWRVGVLATGDGAGGADARSVVLRDVDRARRALIFYADSRSAKVRQIAARPQGTLVLWSPALSWQLRLRVTLAVRTNGLAVSSRWARLKMTPGAQDYLSPLPPGSPIDARFQPERAPRAHFALISAQVQQFDWLELHADGHRRAGFGPDGAQWLQP